MSIEDVVIINIRKIILKRGMKQRAIAEKAGYPEKKFSDMLNKRKSIDAADIAKIANALEVTPNELYFGEDRSA